MTISDQFFQVEFAETSFKFYEKDFVRKYPKGWIETKKMIKETLKRAAGFQGVQNMRKRIDFLKSMGEGVALYKLDFSVAGTGISPKKAGNRVIFSLSNSSGLIRVLLIYSKNHLPKNKSETQWILEMVKMKF